MTGHVLAEPTVPIAPTHSRTTSATPGLHLSFITAASTLELVDLFFHLVIWKYPVLHV
jgi:hypothetical protein